MISPEAIPRIDGDMAALAAHADSLTSTAVAIADTGARVHRTWQGLAPFYDAPDAAELIAATGPVMSVSGSVGEDIGIAAGALRTYAAEAADIQVRLESLRAEANALVTAYAAVQDESTTVTLDDHGARLTATVAALVEAWEAAQLRCANTLRELTGAPRLADYTSASTLVEHGGSTTAYPAAPSGPLWEVYPIDETPLVDTTGHPPLVFGPGALITVPAPPDTGLVDGPGGYTPPLGPGGLLSGGSAPVGASQGYGGHVDAAGGGPADDGIRPDVTGKVHGELPSHVPGTWTDEDLENLAEDLRASIDNRNDEQLRLGEDGPHRARIAEEERLLRQIEKILSGS